MQKPTGLEMTVDVFSQWILWDIWSVGGDKEGEADRSTVHTGQGRDSPAAFGFIGQESRWGAAPWLLKAAVLWLAADNMVCATTVAGNKNHPFPSFKKKKKTQNKPPKSLTKYCVSCVIRTMCLETAGVWSWMQISLVPTGAMLLCSWMLGPIRSRGRARCCSRTGTSCPLAWAEEKTQR